ncbi:MAG: 16S rRNA (uracil(1498)-N(3))-methyltransferase, partial [Pseudohongiellaceae bacterium]
MRVSRVFVEVGLAPGDTLTLDRETSHYLASVLRLQRGDPVRVFNGRDGEFSAEITAVSRQAVSLALGERLRDAAPSPLHIHLALGLSRGDRMDFAIQKATELGVGAITPLYSEFGEVRIKQAARLENKLRHWRRIAVSACEQSGRLQVPEIAAPQALAEWLQTPRQGLRLLLDPSGVAALGAQPTAEHIALVIGPEGGFSPGELALAAEQDYTLVHLGPRILRTETAPVAALSVLQYCYG